MKYENSYPIHCFDVGLNGKIKLSHLYDDMIDTAVVHHEQLQQASGQVFPFDIVILHWVFDIERLPAYGEKVHVCTQTDGIYKFYAYRSWVLDSEHGPIGKAQSKWIGIDRQSRRPVRFDEAFHKLYDHPAPVYLKDTPIPEKTWTDSFRHSIRGVDIDTNAHLNSARYIDLLSDGFDYEPSRVDITFKKEILYPSTVIVNCGHESFVITDEKGEQKAYGKFERRI